MRKNKTFELKEDHIKLLKRMCVGWQDCEWGAPEIDPKRPYGNSNVYMDIAEIIGIKSPCNMCGEFTEEQEELMDTLHQETETALQIILQHGPKPGKYECDYYGMEWEKC